MVTQGNIIHFYGKYKENLETEAQILEGILDAGDQEAWMEKLRQKSKVMRRLYIENETLLNLYIRPFLSGEVNLDDALAEELLNQIREANNEGYEDDLALVEVAELLDGYFQKNKKPTQIRAFYPYLLCFLTYFTKKLHYFPCAF